MADLHRLRRARTWTGAAVAAPVLVAAGLALAWSGGGAQDGSRVADPASHREVAARASAPARGAEASPASTPPLDTVVTGRPRAIVVPSLGVDAPVEPIHVEGGALTPPSDPTRIGWWAEGAQPGARHGRSVLTGHTVHAGGGAFDDLELLHRGDRAVVETSNGPVAYVVTSVRVLGKDEVAERSAALFRTTGPHRLVLVTCEDFDGVVYRSNVVVVAAPR